MIDGYKKRVVAEVPVGPRPEALAVDADHNRVYAANTSGMSVSVIDGANNRVVRTEPVGAAPYAIVVSPADRRVHIALLGGAGFANLVDR